MTSYIPEVVYGLVPGTYDQYGLIPWPKHMTPITAFEPKVVSSGIELTKKAEAYVAAALAEADGVFFLTIDKRDRTSIATTIERLINMLDDMDGEPDIEPMLGAPEALWPRSQEEWAQGAIDEREYDEAEHDPPGFIWGGGSDDSARVPA